MRPTRLHNNRNQLVQRRALRASLTPAEATLWRLIRRSQLEGRKFRRQHGIGPYIVDFYCPAERLVIELEGSAHDSDAVSRRDFSRERFLSAAGLRVLRLENRNVFDNPEGVLQLIRQQFGTD